MTDDILTNTLEITRSDIYAMMSRPLSERDTAKLLSIIEGEAGEPSARMRRAADNYNRLMGGVKR